MWVANWLSAWPWRVNAHFFSTPNWVQCRSCRDIFRHKGLVDARVGRLSRVGGSDRADGRVLIPPPRLDCSLVAVNPLIPLNIPAAEQEYGGAQEEHEKSMGYKYLGEPPTAFDLSLPRSLTHCHFLQLLVGDHCLCSWSIVSVLSFIPNSIPHTR
jgi:hypothetical protein